jgi:type I restriction enzyme M protein
VKTSILILDKELSQKTDKIFFGKVDNDGFDLGAQRREIEKNDLPIITKEVTEYLEGLRKGKVVESEKLTYVPKEKILSSGDIVLTYERYSVKKQNNTIFPIIKLGDICIIGDGNHSSKYPKSSEMIEEGVPFIRATNLKNGKVNDNDILFISSEKHLELKKGHLRTGDVLFCNRGEIGKSAIVGKDFNNSNLNSQLAWIRPNDNILSTYLYNILQTEQIKSIIENTKQGATLQQFTIKQINNLEIPLPPIEVQEEIVLEIEQYQKVIDGAKQVVANYKPVIEIDPSWEMKELESLIDFVSGVTLSIPECEDENGIKIISMADITEDGEIVTHKIRKVKIKKGKYSLLQKGDLLFNWRNGSTHLVGKTGIFDLDGDYVFASFCIGIRVKERLLTKYLWYLLNQYRRDGVYYTFMRKSINGLFNREELKILVVSIPSIEEQKLIIEKLDYEMELVSKSNEIIEIFNKKIQDRINKIWGE